MIAKFKKEYAWLSNFAPVKIKLFEIIYPSVEHAYMSMKSNDLEWKKFCSDLKNTASIVKRKSKEIKLKEDWNDIKVDIMRSCIEQKFSQEPYKTLLLNTKNEYIQEGNWWNDDFWGFDLKKNKGENILGKIIMDIRKKLYENDKSKK
jgi:ribA/ribD-fused uncharacterized protein